MELFKVTCVTCQAKLSVRNAALMGEIVACPKCESMVLVAAPEAIEPSPAVVPDAPLTEPVEQQAAVVPDSSDFDTAVDNSPPAEIPSTDEVASLTVNTASNSTILWWIASFAIGASVTGAFLVLRHQGEPEIAVVADSQNLGTAKAPAITTEKSPPPIEPAEEKKLEATSDRRSPGMSSHEEPATETEAATPPITAPVKTQQPGVNEIDDIVTPSDTAAKETHTPKLVVEPPDEPRIARKFDPLRFDLDQMDLEDIGSNEDSTEATAALPPQPAVEEDDNLIKQQPLVEPAVVRLSENDLEHTSKRSAEKQLKRKVPSLSVKDMPLTDFLDLMSSLSGVPISVDPIELQMAGVSAGNTVSFDAQEIHLDEAITQVLNPLHLEFSAVGPQVIVAREDAARVRKIDYPVDDLIGAQTTAEDFALWIEELIAPESWSRAGGIGTISATTNELQIEQEQSVHFRILFFLERIRLAKKIPLRSRYPERLLGAKPHALEIADRATAPTTFTFSHETPLAEVFRYWQSEIGLPVFVDWPALANVNLWPDSRITCHITNKPWRAALDSVLTPLKLGWRAGPGGTIQITSLDAVNNELLLDIYPADHWQSEADQESIVIHDPRNELVYVRASAAELRR